MNSKPTNTQRPIGSALLVAGVLIALFVSTVFGAIVGIIGLCMLIFTSSRQEKPWHVTKCPYCAEPVSMEANICKHCHSDIKDLKPVNVVYQLKSHKHGQVELTLDELCKMYRDGALRAHDTIYDPIDKRSYYSGSFPPFKKQ